MAEMMTKKEGEEVQLRLLRAERIQKRPVEQSDGLFIMDVKIDLHFGFLFYIF